MSDSNLALNDIDVTLNQDETSQEQLPFLEGELVPLDGAFLDCALEEEDDLFVHTDFVVYKGNALIWGRYNLEKVELKLLNALISMIDPTKIKEGVMPAWSFTMEELIELEIGDRSTLYRTLDEVTDNLQAEVLRLPMRDENGRVVDNGKSYEKVNLFHKSVWDDDKKIATFIFHEDIMPYLVELQGNYTKYHLHSIRAMASKYGIRLYEILRSMYSLELVRKGQPKFVFKIDYEKLRSVLNLGDKYARFSSFKLRVLDPAINDLNRSDMMVKVNFPDRPTPTSTKKVKTIEFVMEARYGYLPVKVKKNGEEIPIADPKAFHREVHNQMLQFLKSAQSKQLIQDYGAERCLRNLTLLKRLISSISNPAGWLVQAIKDDYAIDGTKSEDLERILKKDIGDNLHLKRFVREQLAPRWEELTKQQQDDFLEGRFNSGEIAIESMQFIIQCMKNEVPEPYKPKAKSKSERERDKQAVNDSLSPENIDDTNW